jgi:acetyl esterase
MGWFWDHYLPDGDRFQPDASPLRADDVSGTAPALVITAGFDPLLDEGEAYARRLEQAGVPVTLSRYDGMIHGFFRMPAVIDRANDALAEAAGALRAAFA